MRNKIILSAILVTLFSAFLFTSCKKKDDDPIGPDLTTGDGLISGIVYDLEGNTLPNVKIKIGEAAGVTDSKGEFEITNAPEGSNIPVNFTLDSYKSTQKIAEINDKKAFFIEAALGKIAVTETINSSGGTVSSNDFTLEFESGFVDDDGNSYIGDVNVEATYFQPGDTKFLEAFPGRFEGESTDGSITFIESFGFIDVELFGANGEKLNLADGKETDITLHLGSNISTNAPATIPIWYYDDDLSKWIEEGSASKNGDKYEFSVSHFSRWNCDQPQNTSELKGRVVNQDGMPLGYATVYQKGVDYTGSFRTITDENGNFTLKVKSDAVANVVGIYSGFFSDGQDENTPLTGQTRDIGDIVIDLTNTSKDGWYNLVSGTGGNIYEIDYVSDNVIFMVSDGLFKSTDGGSSWNRLSVKDGNDSSYIGRNYSNSVYFENEQIGYVVGNGLYKTTDGGSSWTKDPFFSGGNNRGIQGIESFNGNLYVIGNSDLHVSNNGSSWTQIGTSGINYISSIYFIDDNNAVVPTYDGIYRTNDGGSNWTKVSPININQSEVFKVFFKDDNVGWIWAIYSNETKIMKTTDGGNTWSEVDFGIRISDMDFVNSNEGWLTTEDGIYYSSDGGNNWSKQRDTPIPLNAIDMLNNQDGLSGGESGILLKTESGGI